MKMTCVFLIAYTTAFLPVNVISLENNPAEGGIQPTVASAIIGTNEEIVMQEGIIDVSPYNGKTIVVKTWQEFHLKLSSDLDNGYYAITSHNDFIGILDQIEYVFPPNHIPPKIPRISPLSIFEAKLTAIKPGKSIVAVYKNYGDPHVKPELMFYVIIHAI